MQFHSKDLSELDELTEEHLGFSALSEGLGFTKQAKQAPQKSVETQDVVAPRAKAPVADTRWSTLESAGPVAAWAQAATEDGNPDLKRKAFSGTGAVAAGPARPAPAASASSKPRVAPPANLGTSVLSEPAAPRELRVAAFLADLAIVLVPMAFGWWLSFHSRAWAIFNQNRRPPLALFALIFAVYFLLSESFGGQSLGKMALGLRVVEDDKYEKPTGLAHAAKRLLLLAAGTALGGLGLLASFWDPKRRPWHDRYSGSIVRRKA